ncbi:MAG: SpoIIE family protein phosphatase, partial [Oscillatoria sp. PMC 1068.18]|nr:SpoIIE family protein phosphatase [Oscillatoria sp. PMC 1068.18]
MGLNVSEHQAKTEVYELFCVMDAQAKTQDFSLRVPVEPYTEVGKIAYRYNQVMDSLADYAKRIQDLNSNLEQKVRDRTAELAQANQELKRLDQLKDQFLANTSHELRTPLNGIIGISESLIEGATEPLSEKTRAHLAMIVSSGRRLFNLVNDILDFSKMIQNNLELQPKPLELRAIVEVVLLMCQPLVIKKNLQLVNQINPDLPAVQADENRLQQIFYNLIGNSIKFTNSGQIEIAAAKINNHQIAISVSDTGIGIPEDKFETIFESFQQGDGSTAREHGGTGLGLAVTKKLVELQKGEIWVESKLNQGSKFTFTLPIADTESVTTASLLETSKFVSLDISNDYQVLPITQTENNHNALTILIVDDEPVNLQVLVNYLSLANYNIVQANNGQEALDLINKGLKPDLVLLDVMMPKMTGYEVTRQLRDRFPPTELPILLLTAKNQVEDLVTGLDIGANDYLSKPIPKDELLSRIKTHLNLAHLRDENLRLATEIDISRRLQEMLLPKPQELAEIDSLDIAGFMEPAAEVGGDYYDILQSQTGIKIGIGDVTGHGLESGLLMIMAQTAIRTLTEINETDACNFLAVINRTLYKNIERIGLDKNMTLVLVDYQQGELCITGQHEEIIIVRANGQVEQIDTIDLGLPLGLDAEIIDFIAQKQVKLNPDDVVVLYTDGITEAENIDNNQYGLERLVEVIIQQHLQTSAQIREAIIADLRQFIGQQKVYDDITLVVLK